MRRVRYYSALSAFAGALFLLQCTGSPFITPNPYGSSKYRPPLKPSADSTVTSTTPAKAPPALPADTFDFANAFADRPKPDQPAATDEFKSDTIINSDLAVNNFNPTSKGSLHKVRILLKRNIRRTTVYSVGKVDIHQGKGGPLKTASFSGRAQIIADAAGNIILTPQNAEPIRIFFPCTLQAYSEYSFVELDSLSLRGSLILAREPGGFSMLNYIDVEDYLRGVVPLEIGRGAIDVIEALKAQAIAARTYTYKRMEMNKGNAFDLTATVEDQVYGGAVAESRMCNEAIASTAGLVMVYRDSLISAYYHSTCGGRTAEINDVWNKSPEPYLKSIRDIAGNGQAYCCLAPNFTWTEVWTSGQLSAIIQKRGSQVFSSEQPFRGTIKSLRIIDRFECGRVKTLRITTTKGNFFCGGDKIRFALRRNSTGNPILRSDNFFIDIANPSTVKLSGKGYGHGVGMCQMGAIGRARNGQNYDQILKAYYAYIRVVPIQ